MIKIAFLVSTLKSSGPNNVLYNIVKYLEKERFKLYIITLSAVKNNSKEEDFKSLGCEVINLNLNRLEGVFLAEKKIEKIVKDNNIDIIHSHGIRSDIINSKFYQKDFVRTCSTLHNYPYYDYVMTYGKGKGHIMAYIHLKHLKKIDSSITCSKAVSDMLMKKRKYKIDYIQNGVDLENYFIINQKEKLKLREKLNLPIDKRIFISVGHLSKRKDPKTIINAFNNIPNSFLIFLGKGELLDECCDLIKDNADIKLIGYVKNVKEYLQASDYFVSASKAEGLPNTVMEAMACGLPVIISDIEPHSEILSFNVKAGRLFKTGNEINLNEEVKSLLSIDYIEASANANEIIQDNLNAKLMSENYQSLYVNLIKNGYCNEEEGENN